MRWFRKWPELPILPFSSWNGMGIGQTSAMVFDLALFLSGRTKACKQTETPKWNSMMEFMILDPADTIRIEVSPKIPNSIPCRL
jgi:hypothetical protein